MSSAPPPSTSSDNTGAAEPFYKAHSVFTPGEGVGVVYAQVLNAGDHLHSCAVDVNRRRSGGAGLPDVHYHLFCFAVVESKVVLPAPQSQSIHLLPVC